MTTGIEWTDDVWNPIVGCTPVSAGCLNCYAAAMARRLEGMGVEAYASRHEPDERSISAIQRQEGLGYTEASRRKQVGAAVRIAEVRGGRAVFTGEVRCLPERLGEPMKWRKPRRVFVNSMSDLFHERVPDRFIRLVVAVMSFAGQHTFQVLTKRPERMAAWFASNSLDACQAEWVAGGLDALTPTGKRRIGRRGSTGSINGTCRGVGDGNHWPLPNVWLGTSVEDQPAADKRIPELLKCPGVRFLSCEPLLGPVDLEAHLTDPPDLALNILARFYRTPDGTFDPEGGGRPYTRQVKHPLPIHWVIAGGESGPRSRPCDVAWLRGLRDQCKAAGAPFFLKQLGAKPVVDASGPTAGKEWLDRWLESGVPYRIDGGCAEPMLHFGLNDRKGGDPTDWPEELRVREFPGGGDAAAEGGGG